MKKKIAVFPGTFDPITFGHIDVIERGAAMFDKLIIGVSKNSEKNTLIPTDERLELIHGLIGSMPNVEVKTFEGMTVDFVKSLGSRIILRGIRTFADFEYEFQLALANRKMGEVETVFVMASAENAFIRSTLIKEASALGGDISAFVPPSVVKCLKKYMPQVSKKGSGLGGEETPAQGRKGSGLQGEGIE